MKKQQTCICCLLLTLVCFAVPSYGADTSGSVLRIYLDADMTGTRASGVSIAQGIRTALSEVDNKLAGREVELVIKDNHGNSRRFKKYNKPFSPYTKDNPDAHEALSRDDFVMGRYGQNAEIILIDATAKE